MRMWPFSVPNLMYVQYFDFVVMASFPAECHAQNEMKCGCAYMFMDRRCLWIGLCVLTHVCMQVCNAHMSVCVHVLYCMAMYRDIKWCEAM